jgi:hypothetical protein
MSRIVTKPRPTTAQQPSTRRPTWASLRRRRLAMAERRLVAAGRALELVPDDPEAARIGAWSHRMAARLRAERRTS